MTAKTRYRACSLQELKASSKGNLIAEVTGMEIGLFLVDGLVYAWRNVCPHVAAPVCEGVICGTRRPSLVYEYEFGKDKEVLRCPWHGWEFDLLTGRRTGRPARLRSCGGGR